jgi:hypothetical protein
MRWFLLPIAVVAMAPGPTADPTKLIREARDRFDRGDATTARTLLDRAATASNDPGLVAFNRGVLLAAAGDHRAAELDFLRCLADDAIPDERRRLALSNRGICLLRHGSTAKQFRIAAEAFRQVLAEPGGDAAFVADAKYHLDLAKRLWAEARTKEAKPPTPNDIPPEESLRDRPMPKTQGDEAPGGEKSPIAGPPQPRTGPAQATGRATPTDTPNPGAGTLAPLPDREPLTKRSPADTLTYLKSTSRRLEAERRTNAELLAGPPRKGVRDW